MGHLTGKTAWITGGATGIGEAAGRALAKSGAHVILSGRREQPLENAADAIRVAGGSAEIAPLDVVDAAANKTVADKIAKDRGSLDIFIANAGLNVPNRGTDVLGSDDFSRVVDINLNGVMNGVLAVLPYMRSQGAGTLILTSSWAGRHASKFTGSAYNATKHAVVALSHSINMENGAHGIRCTALMPGEVNTPILKTRPTPPSEEAMANMLQPQDMGDLVRYIAEAPAHVCFNEILVSPTANRIFSM